MTLYPLIGAQTSTAGGFAPVPERAHLLGAEVVQVFSSNPRQWPTRFPAAALIEEFTRGLQQYDLPLFLHAIYLINLATPDETLWERSIEALASSLALGALTEAAGVVVHIGSHRGEGAARGCARAVAAARLATRRAEESIAACDVASATRPSSTAGRRRLALPPLLLETGVGSGNTLGGTLEEVAGLLDELPSRPGGPAYGLCIDTAHLFASGYPLHHAEGLEQMIEKLAALGLLPRLGLVHLNDSASAFASRHDQHENPGAGQIGYEGLAGVVRHPDLCRVPFVLETPGLEGHGPDVANLTVVKAMRQGLPARAAMAAAAQTGGTAAATGAGAASEPPAGRTGRRRPID